MPTLMCLYTSHTLPFQGISLKRCLGKSSESPLDCFSTILRLRCFCRVEKHLKSLERKQRVKESRNDFVLPSAFISKCQGLTALRALIFWCCPLKRIVHKKDEILYFVRFAAADFGCTGR